MTQEEQRVAIAEMCGWKGPLHPDTQKHIERWPHSAGKSIWWLDPSGKPQMIGSVPDYLSDLNAIHEAEKALRERNLWDAFREQLIHVAGWKNFHSATAAQRTEAILKVVNEWQDGRMRNE